MKRLLLITVLAILMTGASGCGNRRHSSLVGSWVEADGDKITMNDDGTMSTHVKTGSWGILTPTDIYTSGNWRLSGDDIIFEITSSTHMNDELRGYRQSERIVEIATDSFTTIDSDGDKCTYMRVR